MSQNKVPETLKILFVGNSFSIDTAQHLPDVAISLGVKCVQVDVLYIGGCSIRRHYQNILNDAKEYEYYQNSGTEWTITKNVSSKDAIQSNNWDYIAIEHGTIDGSRNTDIQYYDVFEPLVAEIRAIAPEKTKIVFNMHWVGESWHTHPEIVSFNGDTEKMYEIITDIVSNHLVNTKGLDLVIPVGTAIQNARTSRIETLNRDGYHLSLGTGRYIAALAFLKTLTFAPVDDIAWTPEETTEYEKSVAIESVNNAIKTPYSVTKSTL